jgi:imidazolonepropionase-like amidohydrolase
MTRPFVRIALGVVAVVVFSASSGRVGRAASAPVAYRFVHGRWFDGRGFVDATFYSVDGVLSRRGPDGATVIDLKGGFVVPPFADAHNHYIAGPRDIDRILAEYLRDGIFYAKNPASIRRDTLKIADKINRKDSVDVIFANAGITASGGHPVRLYEQILRNVKTPGPDGTFENLAYYIIDTKEDLERKWPMILADAPDFIKAHLLYSEEFEKRRADPAYYGNRGLDPKVLTLIVAKAHESGLRVSCHIETAGDFRAAMAAGVDEINHLPGYYPDPAHPDWFPITTADAEEAARRKITVVTTTYVATAEMAAPAQAEQLKWAREVQTRNLKALLAAGVTLAIGSDVYGTTSLAEATNLFQLGVFDNLTLLKMWCETSALAVFPRRRIGRLDEGYEASFLVLGGNPIEDFAKVHDIRLRFKQGTFIEPTAPAGP